MTNYLLEQTTKQITKYSWYNLFMSNMNIAPFVKWVGGKRQLLNILLPKLPKKFNTYIEPFVGGGALLFALQPTKAIINDLNKELIITYKTIKFNVNRLAEYLTIMEMGHKPEMYYDVRQMDQQNNLSFSFKPSNYIIASRFIYLNKAGFNGLYRVNKNGKFNVPTGKKENLTIYGYENLLNISNYLKQNDIQIFNKSFEKIMVLAQKNDFVYFDPPYDYEKGTKGFDSYQKQSFSTKGQTKLAKVCKQLHTKGINFMVSNHNTKFIKKLYKEFNIEIIKAKRLVGGKGASRKDVKEVIITNYEN